MDLRKPFNTLILLVSWALSGGLLLSCLAYYTPLFPLFDALSIGVPWLMAGNLAVILFRVFKKPRHVLLPLGALMLAFYSFGTVYELGTPKDVYREDGLTVMTFNVRSFSDARFRNASTSGDEIVAFVAAEDPDILCFQEFNPRRLTEFKQYPYYFLTPTGYGKSSQAIFSRYPILDSGQVLFPDSNNNTLYADIHYQGDTLRVYNVHLQSYQIRSRRFIWRNYGQDFLRRLNTVARKHREQARLVRNHRETSPYPSIICGDFNATSFSRPYRILSKGMQDSFREQGRGWGATYYLNQVWPYRIDHILAPPQLEVLAHRNYQVRLSDHLPVLAVLKPINE